ncbi:xylulokinase [Nocardioides terrigena]|uniref:xylulokinase n=1 Tax=Nocardioides terrigena TaxID=424797 RepID=UPI000D2F706F|nr:xylulokinase [Nocardioides terrigena]
MTAVLGIDSSTQSTKALLVDADDGTVLEQRQVAHPPGTEVDPRAWRAAVDEATDGLLERAEAVSVAAQQHGMVALDAAGEPVRKALLWNDVRSAAAAEDLVREWGGPDECARLVGSVLVASFTVSKLRWMRDADPDAAARTESVLLPHDYISAHLAEPGTAPFTDRGDASGTGYFSTREDRWRPELVQSALGREVALPRVVAAGAVAAHTGRGAVLASGTGDNMGAALGMGLRETDVLVSVGTSGVASTRSPVAPTDGTGTVTGFADALDGFLPMTVTLNAAQILDLQAALLGIDHDRLSELALQAPPGAHGLTLSPYYGGERTPNRPGATGVWSGLSGDTDRADLARAAFEALACSLADAVDHLAEHLGQRGEDVLLVGGAARSPALQEIAAGIFGQPVTLPPPAEYVALGAARQAAWALAGTASPPDWPRPVGTVVDAPPTPQVRASYAELRDRVGSW